MPRKIDCKKSNNATSNTVTSLANSEEVTEKMIFRFDDVVTLNAQNVDPDYATRGNFVIFYLNLSLIIKMAKA